MEVGHKRGFDEEDQERLAVSSHERKSFMKSGLGYSQTSAASHRPEAHNSSSFNKGQGNVQLAAASHYNARADTHRRLDSKIDTREQKNLNNWIKSVLIQSAVREGYSVLDLACGKGGDLPKWAKQKIGHYVGIDIAYRSVQDAIMRYNGTKERPTQCNFPAIWCAGNFVRPDLFTLLDKREPGVRFDAVSCQFAIHYSWTSEKDARTALRNAAARLKPEGLFVGTTTDANVLIKKLQEAPGLSFGNSLYRVEFIPPRGTNPKDFDKTFTGRSPYGLNYRFYLKDAVDDCEECLVHFPTFEKIGRECGLDLVFQQNFVDYTEHALVGTSNEKQKSQNFDLFQRMSVLEHFKEGGTMSQDQWEVAHLYKVFVFKKKKDAKQDGSSKWRPKNASTHVPVPPGDVVVLTEDCGPAAMGL